MDLSNSFYRWAIAGLLLGISFIFPLLWLFGLLGGAYFLHLLNEEKTFLRSLLGAWLAWSVKSACATSVFWSVYPIDWLPVAFGNTQLVIIFIYWITASLWLGSGAIFVAIVFKFLQQRWEKIKLCLTLIVFPVSWVIGEMLGSFIFSIMMIGSGGSLNASYSLGYAGYLLAEHEVILQFARLGGVYSLSLLFAIICTVLYLFSKTEKKRTQNIVVGVLALVYITGLFSFYSPKEISDSEGYKVIAIDTSFPKVSIKDRVNEADISNSLNDAMLVALEQNADYILLPEDARYFNQQLPVGPVKSLFKIQFNNPDVVIIDSGLSNLTGKSVLQTFIYNGPDNPVERVHKRYLVPQGEFMPILYNKLFRLFGYSETADYLSEVMSFEVGPDTNQSKMANNLPGILFCFESVSPFGVRTLLKERRDVPFIAHPVSHAWFHNSEILWHQLDTMLKVQAVWNQKYIVSAANHASGKMISPEGVVSDLSVIEKGEWWVVSEVIIPKSY